MANADKLTPQEAREWAFENYDVSVSLVTMHEWCKKFKIGIKVVGRWQVRKKRLKLLLEGRSWQDTNE